jgi:Bacterial Ig-like domain (group 3)
MRLRRRHARCVRIALLALIAFASAAIPASAAFASFPSSPELDNFATDVSTNPSWITPALGEGPMYVDVNETPHEFTGTNGQFAAALWNVTYASPVEVWATIGRSGTGDANLYADVAGGTSGSAHPTSAYFADFGGAASGGSSSQVSIWRVDGVNDEKRLTFTSSPYTQLQSGDQIGLSNNGGVIIAWYRPVGGSWRAVVSTTDSTYTSGRIALEDIPGGDYGFADFGGGISSAPVTSRRTTTAIGSSKPRINAGQQVTYTATVSPVPSLPAGTVAFVEGGAAIAGCGAQPINAAGQASCTATYAAYGEQAVNALYTGSPDGAFAGSTNTSPAVVSVVEPTSTRLSASTATPTVGVPVLYTASVSPAPDGGTVSFTDAGKSIRRCGSQPVRGGIASCRVTYGTPGIHKIRASYGGDANFIASAAPTALSATVSVRPGLLVAGTHLIVKVSCPAHSSGCRISPTLALAPAGAGRVITLRKTSVKLKPAAIGQFEFALNHSAAAYLRSYFRKHHHAGLHVTVQLVLVDGDGSRGTQSLLYSVGSTRTLAQL